MGNMSSFKSAAKPKSPVDAAWIHWKQSMGVAYGTNSDDAYRKSVFSKHYEFATAENAKGTNEFKLGMTKFADLSNEEFKKNFTGLKSFNIGDKSDEANRDAEGAKLDPPTDSWNPYGQDDDEDPDPKRTREYHYSEEGLAESIDWTEGENNVMSPVQDQGKCGSCWAFSSIATLEAKRNQLDRAQGLTPKFQKLSEQHLVDCTRNGDDKNKGCNGGEWVPTFKYMQKYGVASAENYPYIAKNNTCRDPKHGDTTMTFEANTKPSEFYSVAQTEKQLRAAVNEAPVAIGVAGSSLWWQLYFGGVTPAWWCADQVDHAVVLVGYGQKSSFLGLIKTDYWKIRNSWGADWGENGHIRLKRNKGDTGRGKCGTQVSAFVVRLPGQHGPN